MKSIDVRHKLTYWQWVFLQSKVNGASYYGDALPRQPWSWPKNTYLQRRLRGEPNLNQISASNLEGSTAWKSVSNRH
jgi:hypothetical protein